MQVKNSDLVVRAIAGVAEKIWQLTVTKGFMWHCPPRDLPEKIAFAISNMRTVRICVAGHSCNRHRYWTFYKKLVESGVYVQWDKYSEGWIPSTSREKRDLLIIICTQDEKNRFFSGNDIGNNGAVIIVDINFNEADVTARVKQWQSSCLQ